MSLLLIFFLPRPPALETAEASALTPTYCIPPKLIKLIHVVIVSMLVIFTLNNRVLDAKHLCKSCLQNHFNMYIEREKVKEKKKKKKEKNEGLCIPTKVVPFHMHLRPLVTFFSEYEIQVF